MITKIKLIISISIIISSCYVPIKQNKFEMYKRNYFIYEDLIIKPVVYNNDNSSFLYLNLYMNFSENNVQLMKETVIDSVSLTYNEQNVSNRIGLLFKNDGEVRDKTIDSVLWLTDNDNFVKEDFNYKRIVFQYSTSEYFNIPDSVEEINLHFKMKHKNIDSEHTLIFKRNKNVEFELYLGN